VSNAECSGAGVPDAQAHNGLPVKVREGQHVVSKAMLVAYGVSELGERELLGVKVADGEMANAWRSFLVSLIERDLDGVQLVVSGQTEDSLDSPSKLCWVPLT